MTQPTISAERVEEMQNIADDLIIHARTSSAHVETCRLMDNASYAIEDAISALRAQAQGSEAVAVIRFNHGPGTENDMPTVVSCDWRPNGDYALYAAPPAQAHPQGMVVKALEWKATGNSDWVADSVVGQYVLNRDELSAGGCFNLWVPGADDDDFLIFASSEEAKAAAQADYERRILAALATPPAPVDGGVTWECKDYADGWIPFNTLAGALEYQGNTGCIMRPVRLTASRAAVAQDETP